MSGKQHKRELKRQKQAAREAARRRERRQTLITAAIVAGIVALGAVLVFVSLEDPDDPLAEPGEEPTEEDLAEEQFPPENAPPADPEEDEREVACGAELPAGAGEEKPTFERPDDVLDQGVDYAAVLETSCGTVQIDLDEERAPQTVNSFVFLAQQGFFDAVEIFRNATTIGALQTGAGNNNAGWSIGYTLPDELEVAEEEGYPPGAVAMANAGPDTAGSQFFFVYDESFDQAFADNRAYARFATVTEGLDVLEEIGAIDVEGEAPQEQIWIERVTVLADGEPVGEAAPPADDAATDEGEDS